MISVTSSRVPSRIASSVLLSMEVAAAQGEQALIGCRVGHAARIVSVRHETGCTPDLLQLVRAQAPRVAGAQPAELQRAEGDALQ